ncbi:uncharacterized protein LOC105775675 [Gossypium raimondii]|uniref:uncharacterized protein LOC105775675 n=1 Tax=Gossypium raimondii TaxID=29730 RepID=UPI00063AB04A|nr:uncharacterized protein LOC105775675 [Gossypium raimondii]
MNEEETVKQYFDRIVAVVNNIRLLRDQFNEARVVEKVISTLLERYEAKISSLKDSRDLTSISLTELINSLYPQEQRRDSRQEEHQEGVFQAKSKPGSSFSGYKGRKPWSDKPRRDGPRAEAQVAEEGSDHEEQVFAVSCSASKGKVTKGWPINSGYTNHMTSNAKIFKSIDRSFKTRVNVGNGHFIKAEGKGDVLINTLTGNKVVSNVLYVPEIDRNLLSIAQLLENGYLVVFKGKECLIGDPNISNLMSVTMANRSFVVD